MEDAKLTAGTPAASAEGIRDNLSAYLQEKGYKITVEEVPATGGAGYRLVAVSMLGRKEIIEVKGRLSFGGRNSPARDPGSGKKEVRGWLAEALLDSFLTFGRHLAAFRCHLAVALPDTGRSRQLVEKLQPYFTANHIQLKVYLVDEAGKVEEHPLNTLTTGSFLDAFGF